MAKELKSKAVGVYFSETANPYDWQLIACTTDKTFNATTESVPVNSDCEGTFARNLPGDKSWTMDFSGFFDTEPADGVVSNASILELWQNDTIGYFKFDADTEADYIRLGQGWISSFTETGTAGEYMTFTATITGSSPIETTEES